MINIRIIGAHSEVLGTWRNMFKALERTEFHSASLRDAQADDRFVCLLMPATIVYDRLGQRPSVGRSEIFDAKAIPRLRMDGFSYIATTVPFPGRLRLLTNPSGSRRWHFEPKKSMTRKEEVGRIFGSLLTATDEYNSTFGDVIPGVVIDLDVVNSTQDSALEDARAALQAVQRHRAIKNMSDRFSAVSDRDLTATSPFATLVPRNGPYSLSRSSPMERVRQFYLTASATTDAAQLSFTRGEIIDAALSGEVINRSSSNAPHSVRITIISQADLSGRTIEIHGVLDEKRFRLTVQHLRLRN